MTMTRRRFMILIVCVLTPAAILIIGALRGPVHDGLVLGSVLVAYSGGVDSAFLAITAARVLGPRALCVTADSPSYPDRHRDGR